MKDELRQEIKQHLTEDFFPCTANDVEEYASNADEVSDSFFVWALRLAEMARNDRQQDYKYQSIEDLITTTCPQQKV